MKYAVFGAFAVIMAVGAGYRAAPDFDFAAATPEARVKWVQDVAGPFARGLDRGLPKGNGSEPHMSVEKTNVSADGTSVEIIVAVKGPAQLRVDPNVARKQIRAGYCGSYMSTAIGKAGVSMKTRFVHPDEGEMFSVKFSKNDCAPFIKS